MTSRQVIDFLRLAEKHGFHVWIDGGWSVDALLGKQTREHKDLDIAICWQDAVKLRQIMENEGFTEIEADSKWNFVLADKIGQRIDVHAFVREKDGKIFDGIMYPAESLRGRGLIGECAVECIDPKYMVDFLAPWLSKWPEKYAPAIRMLCEKYLIAPPLEYEQYLQQFTVENKKTCE